MTSDIYFTVTSWFPGNVRVKTYSKPRAPPPQIVWPPYGPGLVGWQTSPTSFLPILISLPRKKFVLGLSHQLSVRRLLLLYLLSSPPPLPLFLSSFPTFLFGGRPLRKRAPNGLNSFLNEHSKLSRLLLRAEFRNYQPKKLKNTKDKMKVRDRSSITSANRCVGWWDGQLLMSANKVGGPNADVSKR